jgi:hypothetical protein
VCCIPAAIRSSWDRNASSERRVSCCCSSTLAMTACILSTACRRHMPQHMRQEQEAADSSRSINSSSRQCSSSESTAAAAADDDNSSSRVGARRMQRQGRATHQQMRHAWGNIIYRVGHRGVMNGEREGERETETEREREQGERQTCRVWMCPCARAVRSVGPKTSHGGETNSATQRTSPLLPALSSEASLIGSSMYCAAAVLPKQPSISDTHAPSLL